MRQLVKNLAFLRRNRSVRFIKTVLMDRTAKLDSSTVTINSELNQ